MKNNSEEFVLDYLKKHGDSASLSIVISKPIFVCGSIWQAIDSLIDKGLIEYLPKDSNKKHNPFDKNLKLKQI
jgi:hypothetical protein